MVATCVRRKSWMAKPYGFPFCVEAAGLLYNKTAIENITGKEFVPADYQSLDQFKTLLDELKAGGMETSGDLKL